MAVTVNIYHHGVDGNAKLPQSPTAVLFYSF